MSRAPFSSPSLVFAFSGAVAMAAAMGFGRFFYTPVLPGMMSGLSLSAADAGLIAAGNFAGYLLGAVLSAYGWAAGRERRIALAALFATAVLLAAMAGTSSLATFIVIRVLAGLASAFAMIFTSSIILPLASGRDAVQAIHFGGVGAGIAFSSLVAFVVNALVGDAAHGWRINWLAGALIAVLAFVFIARTLPRPAAGHVPSAEPPIRWSRPLVLLTLSYGLFGFGYVVTATFLIAIARSVAAGTVVEFLAWFVTGLAAAISLYLWRFAVRRLGVARVYVLCLAIEAAGVLASVLLSPIAGILSGGLLLGLTFMAITAYGLQVARILSPESPRRAFAFMTAAFGVGQILGPLVAGWATAATGSFALGTILAAIALAVSVILVLPVVRHTARS